MPDVSIPKRGSSFIFIGINMKLEKLNFRTFFLARAVEKYVFEDPRPNSKFSKNPKKIANRSGDGAPMVETIPNLFFGV